MLSSVLRAIRAVSLGVWMGGTVMSYIVAAYVFRGNFVDQETAGNIMGAIFHTSGLIKLGLAALALASHFGLRSNPGTGRKPHNVELVALLLATAIAVTTAIYLEPRMVELRGQFKGDTNPANVAHESFKHLHGASMGLSTLELVCVTAAMICSVL